MSAGTASSALLALFRSSRPPAALCAAAAAAAAGPTCVTSAAARVLACTLLSRPLPASCLCTIGAPGLLLRCAAPDLPVAPSSVQGLPAWIHSFSTHRLWLSAPPSAPPPHRFWLSCDECGRWFDGRCVGLTEEAWDKRRDKSWACPLCLSNKAGMEVGGGSGTALSQPQQQQQQLQQQAAGETGA